MPLHELDHVNIRTDQLGSLVAFYEEVVGLRIGPRPPFSVRGAWLYCGERAAIHLVEAEVPTHTNEPRLEHFAFQATGLTDYRSHLERHGISYELSIIPEWEIRQLHFRDPDGNHIEISFPRLEPLERGEHDR